MTSLMLTQQASTTQGGAVVESSQPAQVVPMSAEVALTKKATKEMSAGGSAGGNCCGNFVGHTGVELGACLCRTHGDGCLGSLACCVLVPLVCVTGAILVRF